MTTIVNKAMKQIAEREGWKNIRIHKRFKFVIGKNPANKFWHPWEKFRCSYDELEAEIALIKVDAGLDPRS